MSKTFAFVFARGGSKGLPRKNAMVLDNHPLLGHSIMVAKKVASVDSVFVSTDDSELASIGKHYGAIVIDRPTELAQDSSPEYLAWKHAIEYCYNNFGRFDTFLSVPTTAPLRNAEDLENCLSLLNSKDFDIVLTVTKSRRNPWFNMISLGGSGEAKLLNSSGGKVFRRQDAPVCYDITTVGYAAHPSFILNSTSIFEGKVGAIEVPEERAVDIDTLWDFKLAQFISETKGT